ncbi:MAG: protein disulfide oxidoreductase [Planctomycetes bacterium]|nr:protein disulfide oxidoreductase [Planctomycetota bacterium]
MRDPVRGHLETHGAERFPLRTLRDHLRHEGMPRPGEVAALAERHGMTPAMLRGLLSYFTELQHPHPGLRVCRGTSCLLAGGWTPPRAPAGPGQEHPVYCLGYCDRGPAALRGESTLLLPRARGTPSDVPLPCAVHCLGREALVTARLLHGDATTLEAAREQGAWRQLQEALRGTPEAVLRAVEESGERGRGGAGFPTGAKWRRCAAAPPGERYVIANGDEGDPGSFVDRELMERDPHGVLEGMALCGYAVGAHEGILFVRAEYPHARARLEAAIAEARAAGLLGERILGSGFSFDVSVFSGLGSYVCGEETALLNTLEGRRGEVRLRPPYPAEAGLFGRPTVVNNIETLRNVPEIVRLGGRAYRAIGTAASSGTKVLCFNHAFARPGLLEVEFGTPLRAVLDAAGAPADLEAVLIGGPMGSLVFPEDFDVPVCYGAFTARRMVLGHGGVVGLGRGTDWLGLLRHLLHFARDESCGKCVPCRMGSQRACDLVEDRPRRADEERLRMVLDTMQQASLCAFGQLTPGPVLQILDRYGAAIFDPGARR